MKKIFTLVLAVVAMSFCANAQILYENFDNGIPDTWSTIDVNDNGYCWEAVSTSMAQCGAPYTGSDFDLYGDGDCAASWSYYPVQYSSQGFQGYSLDANNYLITPAFIPENNSVLDFYCMSFNGSQYPDKLAVMLSTGGASASDFTTTLMPLTSINGSDYVEKTINLGDYAGQTVRIAFVHQSEDMFGLLLDEVSVSASSSVNEVEANQTSVYPNPANNVINVTSAANMNSIEVYTIAGQKVANYTVNGTQAAINVNNLSNGMYIMQIVSENGVSTKKFNVAR